MHGVILCSSINPPGTLVSEKGDKINYILNHERGANARDIKEATLYFINMAGTLQQPS